MFLDEKIAGSERQIILRDDTGILEAILGVQVAHDDTVMLVEVLGGHQYKVSYFQPDHHMRAILKLVASIAPQVGNVPAHAQGRQLAQHTAGIEFPTVVEIIQVPMGGKIVVGNHSTRHILNKPAIARVINIDADADAVKCLTRQVNAMPARRGLVNHALLDFVYAIPGSWIWSRVGNALATACVMNAFVRNALAWSASIRAGMTESTVNHVPGVQASAAF